MKKLVLFGAGQGAKAFLRRLRDSEQVIAICDNDTGKHGDIFEGYPVVGPAQLTTLYFDQIVITTQWFKEVHRQLITEFNIPSEQLIIPDKAQLKSIRPFADAATYQLANNAMRTLCKMAEIEKVPLLIDFGTLLGLIRNQSILLWDDDIDFAVDISEHGKVLNLIKKFVVEQPIRWRLNKLVDMNNQVASYTLGPRDPHFLSFEISVCFRQTVNGNSLHLPSLGMWYAPEKHFNSYERMQWQGIIVLTPYQPLEYLTFLYGEDWRKEKKEMAIGDYAHTDRISFEKVQQSGLRTLEVIT